MRKGSPACAGQLIKCHQHHQQVKLRQMRQFRTKIHQNAFGGPAPPAPAGGEHKRSQTLAATKEEGLGKTQGGRREEEGQGRGGEAKE